MASTMPSSSRSLRRRPARNSSPADEQQSHSNANSSATRDASPSTRPLREKQQATLEPWIEPVIPKAKPSFEEYGLQRGGVVQNMQPLGTKPSAKLKARLKKEASRGPRRSYQAAFSGDEGMRDTPDTTISGLQTREVSERPEYAMDDMMEDVPLPTQEVEDDDDYMPTASKRLPAARSKTPAINGDGNASSHKTYVHQLQADEATIYVPNGFDDAGAVRSRDATSESIFDAAIRRAESQGSSRLAACLRDLRSEHSDDPDLLAAIKNLLNKNLSTDEKEAFFTRVSGEKNLHPERHDRHKVYRDSQEPSDHRNGSPWETSPSSSTGRRRSKGSSPFTDRKKRRRTSSSPAPDRSPTPPRKTRSKSTTTPAGTVPNRNPSSSRHSATDAVGRTMPSESNVSPAPPADAVSPTSTSTVAGPSVRTTRSKAASVLSAHSAPPAKRSKLAAPAIVAHDTDSELSDVNEEIAQGPPPDQLLASDSRRASVQGGRSRQSSRQPTNLKIKLSTKRHTKRSSEEAGLTPEEEAEREVKRIKLLRAFHDVEFPFSDLRHEGNQENSRASSFLSSRSPTPPSPPPRGSTTHRSSQRLHQERDSQWRGGVRAATASANGGGDSVDHGDSDHDDECTACGGGGANASCKECHRSFHNTCLDPPLDRPPDRPVFCSTCKAGFSSPVDYGFSIMGPMLALMDRTTPAAFALPDQIRSYFEDVQPGTDGEYVETGIWEDVKAKNGWVEPDDTTRLIEKGEVILCCYCGEAARPDRGIIKCDVKGCGALWHLDCIDPPMANPPARNEEKTKRRLFKCPRHVFHDFRQLRSRKRVGGEEIPESERQSYRLRIPRRQTIVPALAPRGRRNNGLIEIDDESSSEEEEFYEDERPDGAVDKYPAKAIKLDFIEKAKEHACKIQKQRIEAAINEVVVAEQSMAATAVAQLSRHSFKDSQAALHLTQLSQKGEKFYYLDRLSSLIMALTSEAPDNVASSIARQQRALERADLQKLKRLIATREAQMDAEDAAEAAEITMSEPVAADSSMRESAMIKAPTAGSPAMESSVINSPAAEYPATDSFIEEESSLLDAPAVDTLTSDSIMMDSSQMEPSELDHSPKAGSLMMNSPAVEPVSVEAPTAEDVIAEPIAVEPVVTESNITEPTAEPVVAEPVVEEPIVGEPVITDHQMAETLMEEPAAIDALSVDPLLTEPSVTDHSHDETSTTEPPVPTASVIPTFAAEAPAMKAISIDPFFEVGDMELPATEPLAVASPVSGPLAIEHAPVETAAFEPPVIELPSMETQVIDQPAVSTSIADLPVAEPPPFEQSAIESAVVEPFGVEAHAVGPIELGATMVEPPPIVPPDVETAIMELPPVESFAAGSPEIESPVVEPSNVEIPGAEFTSEPPKDDSITQPLTAELPTLEQPVVEPPFQYSTATPPEEPPATEPPAVDPLLIEPSAIDSFAIKSHTLESPSLTPPMEEPPVSKPTIVEPHSHEPVATEPLATEPLRTNDTSNETILKSPSITEPTDPKSSSDLPTTITERMDS